jgi:hypothetical protein
MNILFYVEPHALRDSFISHSQPYKIFLDICRTINLQQDMEIFQGVDVRVFSNHVLQEISFNDNLDMWPLILTPTLAEQRGIEDLATVWLPNGVNDWLELCTNENSPITRFYISILERIKNEDFDFDVIVSWGQNEAIASFARTHGIQTVYFELASMRPPFPKAYLIDPVGVNGAASSTYLKIEDIKRFVAEIPPAIIFSALNDEFHETKQNSNLFTSLFSSCDTYFDNDKPTALIPLQLADDANLLLYSPYKSIEEFTDFAVNELTSHGWNILLKPHPHAFLRGGYVEHAQKICLKKYRNMENIEILPNESNSSEYLSLLAQVNLVVTNNSSVGFEALMCGTPCVTLGKSCYSIIGALPTLKEFLDADASALALYKENASTVVTFMLSFMFPLERRIAEELISRIRLWESLRPSTDGDSSEWISRNIETNGWSTWHHRSTARMFFAKATHPVADGNIIPEASYEKCV